LLEENHLRWDSLGEYLALAVSLEDLAQKTGSSKIQLLADALDTANDQYLNNNKSPSSKTGELDNRGSSFYLGLYWAQALAAQDKDAGLKDRFTKVAKQLEDNEDKINEELLAAQGAPVDLGGYYMTDPVKTEKQMRPSPTFNAIIDAL
jgi:isocitrate dehydrogenase